MQTQCFRTMARFVGVMALLSLAVLPACQFKLSTANLGTVTLSKDYKGGKAIDPTETFSPRATLPRRGQGEQRLPGTVVGANWTILEDGEAVVHSKEIELDGEQDFAHFALSSPEDWESGTYHVEIALDGKAKRTINFEVL